MATPYFTTYAWTPGGRPLTIGNPLSALYGMKFIYDSVGEVAEVRQTDVAGTQFLYDRTHVAFGPTKSYRTKSMSGGHPLVIDTTYFPNYTVQTKKGVRNGVTLGGFTYTRDETGRVTARDSLWASDIIDRWYRYDRVGRLLCETTTNTSSCPTSGASPRATYTYNNGTGGLAPDNRASAVFQTAGVDAPLGIPGTYVYAANSNRLTQAASTLQIFHDALGRRTKDDDTYFPASPLCQGSCRTVGARGDGVGVRECAGRGKRVGDGVRAKVSGRDGAQDAAADAGERDGAVEEERSGASHALEVVARSAQNGPGAFLCARSDVLCED
jgi:hypothetical protein